MSTSIEALQRKPQTNANSFHRTALELREEIYCTREKLRLLKQAREHLAATSTLVGMIGPLSGYGFAGLFTRH